MNPQWLDLPARPAKPRTAGLTMVIDNGLPTGWFADAHRRPREAERGDGDREARRPRDPAGLDARSAPSLVSGH